LKLRRTWQKNRNTSLLFWAQIFAAAANQPTVHVLFLPECCRTHVKSLLINTGISNLIAHFTLTSSMSMHIGYLYNDPQMHIYKYAESQIIILPQNVSFTPVTIFRVSHNANQISTQIVVQKLVIKQLTITFDILKQT
jgi:hypothetical protein